MAFNDPLVRLGDYVEACLGKMLDAQKNRGAFQPYLGNSNVRWGAFDLQDLAVMRFEQQEEERYGLRDGDLVVCEGGEPGRCAIWQGEVPNMKIQKALHRIRVKDGLDNYFLYYWFLHAGKTESLEPYFTGTTIKHLTGKALAELKIPLPPIERQRGLAKVLRSLDDKIDLNRRINQTLEAMAQAIFKSWFVDFDPVKAKIAAIEQGQDPLRASMRTISGKTDAELDQMPREHHDQLAATAALFPDEMEESELGEIPKGWAVNTLGSVTNYLSRGISPKYLENGGVLVLNQKCIRDFRVDESKGRRHDPTQRKIDGRALELGDVLINSTGVGTLGRAAQVRCLNEPTIVDSHVTVVRASHELNASYLGQYIIWKQPNIEAMGEGSTGQTELSRVKLAELPVLTPRENLLKVFDNLISPLNNEISANDRESVKLAKLRDTLLPKLLSGELSVSDAGKLADTTGAA
ncbi:TPA: restriction endonuclease subunit S [Pseudomonas aeruginosa]|nr:restriction endonuclease subunit S [Pseudomonas aeruginosa]MBG7421776.1 restriction endonuclease subunit S [Pseudomonas aeruginosa]